MVELIVIQLQREDISCHAHLWAHTRWPDAEEARVVRCFPRGAQPDGAVDRAQLDGGGMNERVDPEQGAGADATPRAAKASR